MGTGKKEKQRRIREGTTKDGNIRVKGENFYRDSKRVQFLNMYKSGKAIKNKHGDVIRAADYQDTTIPDARVQPDRRWFGNTRVISQDALQHFRDALGETQKDTYQVLLRRNKLPMSLLDEKDSTESPRARILKLRASIRHLVQRLRGRSLVLLPPVWKNWCKLPRKKTRPMKRRRSSRPL